MKLMRNMLAVLLALTLLCSSAFASTSEGFHAGLSVDREHEADGYFTVTVVESSVLEEHTPTLTVPCSYRYAIVICPDGSEVHCVRKSGSISFEVFMGGTYTITETDEPPAGSGGGGGGYIPPAVNPPVVVPPESESWVSPFTDVTPDDWFYDSVKTVCLAGLMEGTGNGTTFSPAMPVTRGMLMTVLARLDGVDTSGGSVWYEKGVQWAMANGISDGTNPEANITREQMIVMLYRCAGEPAAPDIQPENFSDSDTVSSWAADAMAWAVTSGIINGADGSLNPQGEATRMEMAAILARAMDWLN